MQNSRFNNNTVCFIFYLPTICRYMNLSIYLYVYKCRLLSGFLILFVYLCGRRMETTTIQEIKRMNRNA
jgi:hypothetical protein